MNGNANISKEQMLVQQQKIIAQLQSQIQEMKKISANSNNMTNNNNNNNNNNSSTNPLQMNHNLLMVDTTNNNNPLANPHPLVNTAGVFNVATVHTAQLQLQREYSINSMLSYHRGMLQSLSNTSLFGGSQPPNMFMNSHHMQNQSFPTMGGFEPMTPTAANLFLHHANQFKSLFSLSPPQPLMATAGSGALRNMNNAVATMMSAAGRSSGSGSNSNAENNAAMIPSSTSPSLVSPNPGKNSKSNNNNTSTNNNTNTTTTTNNNNKNTLTGTNGGFDLSLLTTSPADISRFVASMFANEVNNKEAKAEESPHFWAEA